MAVKPLLGQLAWRNMTAILCIAKAPSSMANFPWKALLKKQEIIRAEMAVYNHISDIVIIDPYAGYKSGGAGSSVPNLAYLSVQLLIVVGGDAALSFYKGLGSKTTKNLTNKPYLDALISEFKRDTMTQAGDYELLKATEKSLSDVFQTSGLSGKLAKMMSAAELVDVEDDDKEKALLMEEFLPVTLSSDSGSDGEYNAI